MKDAPSLRRSHPQGRKEYALSTLESTDSYPPTHGQRCLSQSTKYTTVQGPEDVRTGASSEVVCEAWISSGSFFPTQDVWILMP